MHSTSFVRLTRLAAIALLMAVLALCACKRVPSDIIGMHDMAQILADVHTAEAVTAINAGDYAGDSARQALKMAVFKRHGVTSEQFDSSLVWYAHNINRYIEVYDETIEILQDRSQNVGTMLVQQAVSMAGDSVDVWPSTRHLVLTDRLPSRIVSFDLPYDENWENGDMYSFRAKILDGEGVCLDWVFVADYDDNTVDIYGNNVGTGTNGWNECVFITDSTKQLQRLRGYFAPVEDAPNTLWIDSISLIRKRLDASKYQMRYQVRRHHQL